MQEEKDKLHYRFSYTDVFGNNTCLRKEVSSCAIEDSSEYDIIIDEFKDFLVACGFTDEVIERRLMAGG